MNIRFNLLVGIYNDTCTTISLNVYHNMSVVHNCVFNKLDVNNIVKIVQKNYILKYARGYAILLSVYIFHIGILCSSNLF